MFDEKQNHIFFRLIRYAGPYKGLIALAMLASLGVAGTDVLGVWLVKYLVDDLLAKGDLLLVKIVPLLVIAVMTFKGFSRYVQEYNIRTAGQGALQDIRNHVYRHVIRLSMRFFSAQSTGGLMSRILNDINVLQAAVSDVMVILLRESVTMISLIVYSFYTDWRLAAVAFVAIPATAVPAAAIGRMIKKYSKRGQAAMGEVTAALEQSVSGIKVIKAFATEEKEVERFAQRNTNFFTLIKKTFRYSAATAPVMEILTSLGSAAVLWYGLDRAIAGDITKGELVSIVVAILAMYSPMKRLIKVNNRIQRALGAAERVFSILDTDVEIYDAKEAVELPRSRGQVSFENVSFAYDEKDNAVLRDFSLEAGHGQIIALVGQSGAGKSTIISLLNRFYDPQEGRILIDGYDLRDITQNSLHNSLALVDQDTFLFHDDIYSNIGYGSPEASPDEIRDAAKQAFAHEFIEQLTNGYETVIGNRGVRLSGGQRQRICIARAILRDAPILLLDEATSALDTESEVVVQKALSNLMRNRTTFVIAHRLSTIKHADTIVVMEHGQIVEQGPHDQLLKRNGAYRRLFDAQFSGQQS